ncbi:hypothetical protein AAU61_04640 [Desulfocarbo indianensis]|nr:hypothetical protein AAU61_04640 [Desulfocarbo indianensis]
MKRRLFSLLIIGLILCWALAAQALTVRGRVSDAAGRGLAGALVSDEIGAVASGADGSFSLESREGRLVSLTPPAGYAPPARWWWPAGEAAAGELRLKLTSRPASERPLVAFISDPHLFDERSGPVKYPVTPEVARRPLATWARLADELKSLKPELVIVSGDICADADKGDEDHARAQLAIAVKAMAQLPQPARVLPGNHDARYREGRVELGLWRETLGPARQVFLLPGAAFILLDNLGRGQSSKGKPVSCGNLPDEALAWLRRVLPLLPPESELFVATHYPVLTPIAGSNPLHKNSLARSQRDRGLALRDADQNFRALAEALAGRKLTAFINGHEHAGQQSLIQARRPFMVYGLPALCGGWWQGDRQWGPLAFPSGYGLLRLGGAAPQAWPRMEIREVKY